MKKRVIVWMIPVIIWSITIWQTRVNVWMAKENKLVEAFHETKAIPLEGRIEVSADVKKVYLDQKAKESVLVGIAKDMGINKDCTITRSREGNNQNTVLSWSGSHASLSISFGSMELQKNKKKTQIHQYIFLEYVMKDYIDSIVKDKNMLENLFVDRGLTPYTNINMSGKFEHPLKESREKQITQKVLTTLEAKEVCRRKKENELNIYGYSKILSENMQSQNGRINLNMVFVKDEQAGETRFYLAMPYVSTEF